MIGVAYSQTCGVCDIFGNFRCVNENTYQLCSNNEGIGAPTQCPSGTLCSISNPSICAVPDIFPSTHDCESQCIGFCHGTANTPGQINYICTGPNTYRFCSELNDDGEENICQVGSVCTIDAPCVRNDTSVAVAALCPNSNSINWDPNSLCVGKLDRSRNPLFPPDPFCEK